MKGFPVCGVAINGGGRADLESALNALISTQRGGYVCVANAQMITVAKRDPSFFRLMKRALLVMPDGMPLVWHQRMFSKIRAERFCGRDIVHSVAAYCAAEDKSLGLYGATPLVLKECAAQLLGRHPNLMVNFIESPSLLSDSPKRDSLFLHGLLKAQVDVLLVCLGCPKQERWMAAQRFENTGVIAIGIGAAVDFISGKKPVAPVCMQKAGLEWLFRLASEPRRLAWRYLSTNLLFVFYVLTDAISFISRRGKRNV